MIPNFVDIAHEDPTLTGRVTFRRPNFFERVQIASRRNALAFQSFPIGTEPEWDKIQADLRADAGCLATLERLITTAPIGFYNNVNGSPVLEPGRIQDASVLWTVFIALTAFTEAFRDGRVNQDTFEEPRSADDLGGIQSAEPRPTE